MEANLRNNHLWRGIEVADGLVLTSDVNYTFLNGLVTFGFWGGTNTEGVYKEFNNHLSVQYKGFSFALWDTYNFSKNATYNNEEFFNYSAHSTGRFLDAIVSYRFGEKFPLLVSWATVIFGRDRNEDNTSNKYSTFCYLEYPVYKQDKWRVDVGLGGAFALKQCGSESNFYGDTSGIVHATISVGYDLAIGGYELPVNISTVWNPQADRAFFQIGVRLVSF
ncbi:MAG: hypothetical protein Q4D56_07930 [Bacteroides sp.]|nr:hypothetical protein [Bacteroides sp.]